MYIYFNSSGVNVRQLVHGPAARQGGTDFKIYAYIPNTTSSNAVTIAFTKPDGTTTIAVSMALTSITFNLTEGERARDVEPFVVGQAYSMWWIAPTIFDQAGTYLASIYVDGSAVQGSIEIPVQKAAYPFSTTITPSQYNELVGLIGNKITKNDYIYLKVLNGLEDSNFYDSTTGKYRETYFEADKVSIIYDKTTKCLYALDGLTKSATNPAKIDLNLNLGASAITNYLNINSTTASSNEVYRIYASDDDGFIIKDESGNDIIATFTSTAIIFYAPLKRNNKNILSADSTGTATIGDNTKGTIFAGSYLAPINDNGSDLGTSGDTWKDIYISGSIKNSGGQGVTIAQIIDVQNKASISYVDTGLATKVDKVTGKELSTNDFTNAYKGKLDGISTGANKVEGSLTNGNIKIDGVETTVYTEVANTVHDANYHHITVTGTTVSDGTNTLTKYDDTALAARVTANETAIAGKEPADATILKQANVINDLTHTHATDLPLSAAQGKILNEKIENIEGRGRFLSVWDASTGEPGDLPGGGVSTSEVYNYKSGDYFIVSENGSYFPIGQSIPSGTTRATFPKETRSGVVAKKNDSIIYSGDNWILLHTPEVTVTFSSITGQPTDNTNLNTALGLKQNNINASNKLSADFVNDTNTTNKFITSSQASAIAQNTSDITGLQTNKENVSNKVTSLSGSSTNTQYPSAKCVYDSLALKQNNLSFTGTPSSSNTVVLKDYADTGLAAKQNVLSFTGTYSSSTNQVALKDYVDARISYQIDRIGDTAIDNAVATHFDD